MLSHWEEQVSCVQFGLFTLSLPFELRAELVFKVNIDRVYKDKGKRKIIGTFHRGPQGGGVLSPNP